MRGNGACGGTIPLSWCLVGSLSIHGIFLSHAITSLLFSVKLFWPPTCPLHLLLPFIFSSLFVCLFFFFICINTITIETKTRSNQWDPYQIRQFNWKTGKQVKRRILIRCLSHHLLITTNTCVFMVMRKWWAMWVMRLRTE